MVWLNSTGAVKRTQSIWGDNVLTAEDDDDVVEAELRGLVEVVGG